MNISTASTTYDSFTLNLAAEASSLGIKPGSFPRELFVKSERTGKVARFVYARRIERNGDLVGFHYDPANDIASRVTGGFLLLND